MRYLWQGIQKMKGVKIPVLKFDGQKFVAGFFEKDSGNHYFDKDKRLILSHWGERLDFYPYNHLPHRSQ